MKKLVYAIPVPKVAPIVDARSPYDWQECGTIVVARNISAEALEQVKRQASIPENALCVCASLV